MLTSLNADMFKKISNVSEGPKNGEKSILWIAIFIGSKTLHM